MISSLLILDVAITNERIDKVLEYLYYRIRKTKQKTFIITPNPEMLVYASKHLAYKDKLNHADIALPDGVGLFFASSFMGKQLKARITGVDFIEELCKLSREKPLSMGFVGGGSRVAERAVDCLREKYPWIKVDFWGEEWGKVKLRDKIPIDILFVAFGVPKQEEWIYANLEKLPVKAAIGVGGAFDFISGTVKRAPFLIRFMGLEWLFRLIREPWRWKRQLALFEFVLLVFKQKSPPKEAKRY